MTYAVEFFKTVGEVAAGTVASVLARRPEARLVVRRGVSEAIAHHVGGITTSVVTAIEVPLFMNNVTRLYENEHQRNYSRTIFSAGINWLIAMGTDFIIGTNPEVLVLNLLLTALLQSTATNLVERLAPSYRR